MCSDTVYKRVCVYSSGQIGWREIIVAALMVAASLGIFLWVFRLSYWAKPPRLSTYTLSISEYPGPGDACCREPQPLRVPATGEPSSAESGALAPSHRGLSPDSAPLCLPGQALQSLWASEICTAQLALPVPAAT